MAEYIIQDTTLEGIADAIRDMRYESGTLTPAQMEAKIRASRLGLQVDIKPESHINPETGRWVRPSQYPNLDSLTIGDDFDGVYLTYDLTKIENPWMCVYAYIQSNSGSYNIDRGHIENGEFVVDATTTQTSNNYYRQTLDSANGNYQIFRITPASNKHITRFGFGGSEATDTSTSLLNMYQPCVERVGRLDYVGSFDSSPTARTSMAYSTMWLERDHVECAGLNTLSSMNRTWDYSISLQEVYVDWDTSNWTVTTLYRLFGDCCMLENIIGIDKWDTSNWVVNSTNSLNSVFYGCIRLKHLPIGNWNTSNWQPTNMRMLFAYCYNLRELDLSNWNTSNWAITDMYLLFSSCKSITSLDLSSWDVSNWAVTNLQYTFQSCHSLVSLDVSGWDTSNWRPTSLYSLFSSCYSLKELDLSDWDVSDWRPTIIENMFGMDYSLQKVKTGWDTSDWQIDGCASIFSNCVSLKEHDIDKWDVSNWAVTKMNSMFSNAGSLTEIDLSGWDCSNWAVTSVSSLFGYCHNLRTIVMPSNLDLSGVTNVSDLFRNIKNLRNINAMGVPMAVSYGELFLLSPTSLVNILNSLPTVTKATTITLGVSNQHKITAADIAVATQKGWTVA